MMKLREISMATNIKKEGSFFKRYSLYWGFCNMGLCWVHL